MGLKNDRELCGLEYKNRSYAITSEKKYISEIFTK